MAIPIPVTKTRIATVPWGIPITNEVNRLTGVTTPTAWTTATLQNGFTAQAGIPTKYRKIGDIVSIRGRVDGSTSFVPVFTLPVGFRPPFEVITSGACVVASSWGWAGIYILTTGEVMAMAPATMTSFSLPVSFSTTP